MITSASPSASLSPLDVSRLHHQQPRVRILDVRTPGEYQTAHIPGSYNVPLDTLGEHAQEIQANVQDPIVLVCQSGQRARKADAAFSAAGMANLHVLDGGLNGWIAAGLPVKRGAKRVSMERQVRMVAGSLAAAGGFLAALVNPVFGFVPAVIGTGLVFAGVTDTCGMALLLARLPYNRRSTSCDVGTMVRSLIRGDAPLGGELVPGSTSF